MTLNETLENGWNVKFYVLGTLAQLMPLDWRKNKETGVHWAQVKTLAFTPCKRGAMGSLEQKTEVMDLSAGSGCHVGIDSGNCGQETHGEATAAI